MIPGFQSYNPRCNANSAFYQTGTLSVAWSKLFTFTVGWRSPPKSNASSLSNAWLLAQYYVATDSVTSGKIKGESVVALNLWNSLVASMGNTAATAALASLERWYGTRSSFSTTIPFKSTKGIPPNTSATPAAVEAMVKEFNAHPLDYLYYPIRVRWLTTQGEDEFVPTGAKEESACFLVPDTTLLGLAELAVLGYPDLAAFHYILQLSYWWMKFRAADKKQGWAVSASNLPNLSRILGNISYALQKEGAKLSRADATALKASGAAPSKTAALLASSAKATAATWPVTPQGNVLPVSNAPGAPTALASSWETSPWTVAGAAVGVLALLGLVVSKATRRR